MGVTPDWRNEFELIPIGAGRKLKEGKDLAILSLGHVGNFVIEAIPKIEEKGISVAHYDMRFLKPMDTAMLHEVFTSFKKVITVEDGVIQGGFGSAVIEYMVGSRIPINCKTIRSTRSFHRARQTRRALQGVWLRSGRYL